MRRALRAASLHTKLMLALALVVSAIAAISVAVLTDRERERRLQELDGRADRIAELFSRSLAAPLWALDWDLPKEQLKALAPNPEVVYFRVRAEGQGLVAEVVSQPHADLSKAVLRQRPIIYTPAGGKPQKVGDVELAFTRSVAEKAIQKARTTVVAMVISVMLVLYLVTFVLVRRLVGRPILQVEKMLGRIAAGDFGARCEVRNEDEIGRLAGRVNAMADALEQSTHRLRESEAKYRGIFENAAEGIFRLDRQGRLHDANPALARLLGFASPQALAEAFNASEDAHPFRPFLSRAQVAALFHDLDAHGEIAGAEYELTRADGTQLWVQLNARGRSTEIEALVTDITARKQAIEELRRHRDALEQAVAERTMQLAEAKERAEVANRAKGDFLANMSHEIRTPMNAIIGMSHLALQSGLTARQQNYVRKIQVSSEALLGIVNDILDFSKIEAGKLDIEQVPFDLGDVLDNLANVVGLRAEEKGLELLYADPPDLPMALVGDPLRLGQVLLNLGNNAVKFTERGEVTLSVEVAGRQEGRVRLRFEVHDTGIGISAEQQQRLFRPFEQADASTSRRYGGTGLGLAICTQLVRLMGGELQLHSEPGRGSRFFFTLPFGLQDAAAPVAAATRPGGMVGSRTLVVDDNAAARELLAAMLQTLGMHADAAEGGEQALQAVARAAARGNPYDLVLLDWKMPGMDGIECARRIVQAAAGAASPPTVLMLTAFSRDEVLRRLEELGVQVAGLLTKPVTPSTLFDACCKALGLASLVTTRAERRKGALIENQSRLKGARILLVEDNDLNREVALELLQEEGLIVEVAHDGRDALAKLEAQRFDGVLMDCQMPVMDGFAATRELRRRPGLADLPVIAMTANVMVGDREKALASGMNDHIAKPIVVDEMFATLSRWIVPRVLDVRSLPGVDAGAALARLRGSESVLRRVLLRFAETEHDFVDRFRALQSSGDAAAAMRMAHDLHSVSGTLGMQELQVHARALEIACRNGDAAAIPPALEAVARALQPVLRGLDAWRGQEQA